MGPTWGPPGSCRPQMGPMLAPWTLLSRQWRQMSLFLVNLGSGTQPNAVGLLLSLWSSLGRIFSKISVEISYIYVTKIYLKIPSTKWWPFCSGFNLLSMQTKTLNALGPWLFYVWINPLSLTANMGRVTQPRIYLIAVNSIIHQTLTYVASLTNSDSLTSFERRAWMNYYVVQFIS